jgi:hypothetical protein
VRCLVAVVLFMAKSSRVNTFVSGARWSNSL